MIEVNSDSLEWKKGMTVNDVLTAKKYSFPLIIVKINGNIIEKHDYTKYEINDGAKIEIIHLMSGG